MTESVTQRSTEGKRSSTEKDMSSVSLRISARSPSGVVSRMFPRSRLRWALVLACVAATTVHAQRPHPSLMITAAEATAIREALGHTPLLDTSFQRAKRLVEEALARPISVPWPVDASGPVHQRHKENYLEMQQAGVLYAVTGDERYARFVREMLLRYADLWPTLPKHPQSGAESYGRLFWQSLNETVWLVHATQAYDCVHPWLSAADRATIEQKLIRPMAQYFVTEHASVVNRIHNHGAWMAVAVGMSGYVLGDKNLSDVALYGTNKDRKGGFLAQLSQLYSPDGYYTEGAYYARYSLMPFVGFAQVIANNEPSLRIFEFRDGLIRKAVLATLQLTTADGSFIPINDALKEKTFLSPELILATNTVYRQYRQDPGLLWVVRQHGEVLLNGAGLAVAEALKDGKPPMPFPYTSLELRDGGDGTSGGLGILRSGPLDDQSLLLMKYTSHGLSHGHFDKLAILYYDQGREILQDYGAARFLNVETKVGGRYLPETKSWARQTVAHNTVVVDERSHFDAKESVSEQHHGERHFFQADDPSMQVVSATAAEISPGVRMQRTVAMVPDPRFAKPLIIDVLRVTGKDEHQFDLPYYYFGQIVNTTMPVTAHTNFRRPLGTKSGYEHLWVEADGAVSGPAQVTLLNGRRYYTLTMSADQPTHLFYTRIGANDPNFNLRTDPGLLFRRKAKETVFASTLEPHGTFDPIKEFSIGVQPTVTGVSVLASTDEGTVVELTGRDGFRWIFMTTNKPADGRSEHEVAAGGVTYRWKGNARLEKVDGSGKVKP
jgi:hypothetical protein